MFWHAVLIDIEEVEELEELEDLVLDVELELVLELLIELLLLAEKLELDDGVLTPSDPPPQPVHSNRIASNHIRDRLELFIVHVIEFPLIFDLKLVDWSLDYALLLKI